jgi:hypothetical protein
MEGSGANFREKADFNSRRLDGMPDCRQRDLLWNLMITDRFLEEVFRTWQFNDLLITAGLFS